MRAGVGRPPAASITSTSTLPMGRLHSRDRGFTNSCFPPQLFKSFNCGRSSSFEIEPETAKAMVGGHRDHFAFVTVINFHHPDIEVAGWLRGYPGQTLTVRRPRGIDVDEAARGQRDRPAGAQIAQYEVDALAKIF